MNTFTQIKPLSKNPRFQQQRRSCLSTLDYAILDTPLTPVVAGFNALAYCFSLQSCFGHFLCNGQMDEHNLLPLPLGHGIRTVEYRIAYIAICIDSGDAGRALIEAIKRTVDIDPQNIQFGCAEWFWQRQINSYVLQVEPDRFKHQDRAILEYSEAVLIERVRDTLFSRLETMLHDRRLGR